MERNWTEAELAYFAGIVDGEGCIQLRHGVRKHIFASILTITNTDPRLIEWIRSRFGGFVYAHGAAKGNRKPSYQWVSSRGEVVTVLQAILPFMIVKRSQAELLLAYRATVAKTKKTPEHVKQERFRLHDALAVLNKRGIA